MEIFENIDSKVEVLFFFFKKFGCMGVYFVSDLRQESVMETEATF